MSASLQILPRRCLSGGDGSTQVLDILLFDKTGPIMGTLQNEPLETIVEIMRTAPPGIVNTRINSFCVAELANQNWNGWPLSRVRRIQSVPNASNRPGTIATLVHSTISPFLHCEAIHTVLNASACTGKFAALPSSFIALFRATFKGIVVEVFKGNATKNHDNPSLKREFGLSLF